MNQKAQSSFDLIIAVIIFLIASQIILSITSGFEGSQERTAVQSQLQSIAEAVSGKASEASLLSASNAKYSFNFSIPSAKIASGEISQERIESFLAGDQPVEHEIAIVAEVQYDSFGNPANTPDSIKSKAAAAGDFPSLSVVFNGDSSTRRTLLFGLVDGVQKKIFTADASSFNKAEITYSNDYYSSTFGSTNVLVKELIIGEVHYPVNRTLYNNGDLATGITINPGTRQACTSAQGFQNCKAEENCIGKWAFSQVDRCCIGVCTLQPIIQASAITNGEISEFFKAVVEAQLPSGVSTSCFRQGADFNCTFTEDCGC